MNKLYRSRVDTMFAGVCGGLGSYLGIDSTFVRLFFVLLTMVDGIGLLIYLVLAIIVPQVPTGQEENILPPKPIAENPAAIKAVGGGLVFFGLVALIDNFHIYWLKWLDFDVLWPILLIAAGVTMLYRLIKLEKDNV